MHRHRDSSAVSPVIATVLMVAITVVLSGVLLLMLMPMITPPDGPSEQVDAILPTEIWEQNDDVWVRTGNNGDSPYYTGTELETNLSSGTISAWIKVTSSSPWAGILMKGNAVSNNEFDQSYGLQMAGANLRNIVGWCQNGSNNDLSVSSPLHVLFFIAQNNSANTTYYEYAVISPIAATKNQWYFVVATWNNEMISMDLFDADSYIGRNWLNVSNVLSSSAGGGTANAARQALIDAGGMFKPRPSPSPLLIGGQALNNYIFRGEISQPALFPSPLTTSQMNHLWNLSKNNH